MTRTQEGRDLLAWLVALTTTAVWLASACEGLVTGEFHVFEIATAPYLIVVGYITGAKVLGRGDEK